MEPIENLDALRKVVGPLMAGKLVVYLTRENRRGAVLADGFQEPHELDRLRAYFATQAAAPTGKQSLAREYVLMQTSLGSIKLELDEDKAPISVKNFLSYVDDKFYDNTIFHRVISGFMIQGGGFEPGMRQKPTKPPIKNESGNGLSNVRGSLAMARTSDLNSATAQFYINVVDNSRSLDQPKYCVFGKVADKPSMDVVDNIKAVRTGQKGHHGDVPVEDVVIQSIRRVEA